MTISKPLVMSSQHLACCLHRLPADSADEKADINRACSYASFGRRKFQIAEAAIATGTHTRSCMLACRFILPYSHGTIIKRWSSLSTTGQNTWLQPCKCSCKCPCKCPANTHADTPTDALHTHLLGISNTAVLCKAVA